MSMLSAPKDTDDDLFDELETLSGLALKAIQVKKKPERYLMS